MENCQCSDGEWRAGIESQNYRWAKQRLGSEDPQPLSVRKLMPVPWDSCTPREPLELLAVLAPPEAMRASCAHDICFSPFQRQGRINTNYTDWQVHCSLTAKYKPKRTAPLWCLESTVI